jgi:hypothetical protein
MNSRKDAGKNDANDQAADEWQFTHQILANGLYSPTGISRGADMPRAVSLGIQSVKSLLRVNDFVRGAAWSRVDGFARL